MKRMKKFGALALAFVMSVTLLPGMSKVVKAADDGTSTWSAANYTIDATADSTKNEDLKEFSVGALTVDPLYDGNPVDGVGQWQVKEDTNETILTGGKNPRSGYDAEAGTKANPTESAAPICGTVLKVNTSTKGEAVVGVLQGSGKVGYVSRFAEGTTTGGKYVCEITATEKAVYDYTFDVEVGYDYYVYVSGSKAGFVSVSYTPAAEDESVKATVEGLSSLGASYRDATDEYTNGIRFGSTLDKTKIDFDNNVKESGTLVALATTMESKNVTELVLNSDGTTAAGLKVRRTTYAAGTDDNTLNYTLAVVNIPDERLDIDFVTRAYIIMNDGTVYYGDQVSASWKYVKEAGKSVNNIK